MSNEDLEVQEVKEMTKKEFEELKFYASKGELYMDLIEQFKLRLAVDEGILNEEVKEVLLEAKEAIVKLRTDSNKLIDENLTIKSDCMEMAAQLYLNELCEKHEIKGKDKKRIFSILEGIKDKEEIDKKFNFILEQDIKEKHKVIQRVISQMKKPQDQKNVSTFFETYGIPPFCSDMHIYKAINEIMLIRQWKI